MPSVVGINYDYTDVPTVAKFAGSNAFIRGLMGPFRCIAGSSEFLTPTGWKRIDQYEPSDLVAQWHPETNTINWVFPTAYVKEPSPNGLIEFDGGIITMRLSSGHRVPHYDYHGKFQIKTAAEIATHPSKRKIPVTFALENRSGLNLSDDLIRFAVMMHADGHYPKAGTKAQICVRKERKKERIRATLTAIGVKWSERTYKQRPTETTFDFEPPYTGKHFDKAWWDATPEQLEIVLDEAAYWDGNVHDSHSGFKFFTAHKDDADFIQYAAHATGNVATLRKIEYADQPNWKPTYIVHVLDRDSYKSSAVINSYTKITKVPSEDGFQYCFNVPTGFFVARCDDTIFITGNSGKSSGCVIEIVRRGVSQRPSPDGIRRTRWLVVRNTFTQLEDSTIRTCLMWLPPQNFGRYFESDHTYMIKGFQGCEIEIMFRALDRPEHVKNLLSLEVTGAWVNEAREVPWPIIDAIQGRVGQYPQKNLGGPSWYGLFMDTNPPDVDSKWYRFFEETKHDPKFAEIFKQPSGRGPNAENLSNLTSPTYYLNLAQGKSTEYIKVYIDGEYGYVIEGRPVYSDYKDQVHCKSLDPVKGLPIYRGFDFGLTPACVFSQILPDGRWLVFDEITSDRMGIDRFSDEVIEHCSQVFPKGAEFIDIGDPAGESKAQTDEKSCFDILQAKGIMIEGGIQTLTIRLESVRKTLTTLRDGEPMFVIHPRCKMLRKGFQGAYQFRRLQVAAERYTNQPDKNPYSHPHDALQYVATRLFGGGLTAPRKDEFDGFENFGYREDDRGRSEWTGY